MFLNLQEDQKEEYDKTKNIIEVLHSRLRPESYKPTVEFQKSKEGEFDKLIRMSQEDELNGQNNN
ncbi:MAG: hypothetical protein ACFFG0_36005 [Candidatus Thorarchaeota archaeon]